MLMMELKKILTEKYMMSANCPAMRDANMKAKGIANNLWSTRRDHAMILMGLGTSKYAMRHVEQRKLCAVKGVPGRQ